MSFAAIQPERKWHQTPHWFITSLQPWLPLWHWHEITQRDSAARVRLARILLHIKVLVPAKTRTLHCLANSFFPFVCVSSVQGDRQSPSSGQRKPTQSTDKTPIFEDDGLASKVCCFIPPLIACLFSLCTDWTAGRCWCVDVAPWLTFTRCANTTTLNRFTLLSLARLKACQWGESREDGAPCACKREQ